VPSAPAVEAIAPALVRRAVVDGVNHIERGRESYARRAWRDAYEALTLADQVTPLSVEDLDLLATSAYMLGRDDDYVSALERAHQLSLDGGDGPRAVRCALWMGMNLMTRGEVGRGTAWLGRARRLVERQPSECVERGLLLLPLMFEHEAAGDRAAAIAVAAEAVAIGERCGDADLFALAAQSQGILLIGQGRVVEGLRLLDEAMLAVTAGALSPIVNGFVYCGVIMGCQAAYEPRRAREWTAALTRWCEQQPDLVSFTGTCLVHRAEIMQLHGAWPDALAEARRASERCVLAGNAAAAAQAAYRQGEVHRLQGEFAAAEEAYRDARRGGYEPQPGLALLRLAQGNGEAATAAIRRLVGETSEPAKRAALLPAYVEIMLAAGDVEAARGAGRELREIGERHESEMMDAIVAQARGAIDLAAGDAGAALVDLRRAHELWRELEAPFEAARTRVLMGRACAALGDDDTASMEFEAAREVFARLGAAPDLEHADGLMRRSRPGDAHGLTARELEVLRRVAAGASNREIAVALVISEHTVARHVQNIFAKLGVSSRTAAGAFAFSHHLV
jgi:DNA-binding CsgD family transcriptional regulator/tetratricopeptide (TPR) repeat protein